jgi:hypothetical protein
MSLASLKELLGRRTPGPWRWSNNNALGAIDFYAGASRRPLLDDGDPDRDERNAEAIVQCLNAADELVAVAQLADEGHDYDAHEQHPPEDGRVMDCALCVALSRLNDVLGGEE